MVERAMAFCSAIKDLAHRDREHGVGRRESHDVGEARIQVVEKAWLPVLRAQLRGDHLREEEVGCGTVPAARLNGPPRSSSQYQIPKTMMLVR